MNYFDLESGSYPDHIAARSPFAKAYRSLKLPECDLHNYNRAEEARKQSLVAAESGSGFTWNSFSLHLEAEVRSVVTRLTAYAPELRSLLDAPSFESYVTAIGTKSIRSTMVLLAKLYNSLDAFEPVAPQAAFRDAASVIRRA